MEPKDQGVRDVDGKTRSGTKRDQPHDSNPTAVVECQSELCSNAHFKMPEYKTPILRRHLIRHASSFDANVRSLSGAENPNQKDADLQ